LLLLLLLRREVHQAFLLLGMAVGEGVNRSLKNAIKQSRPSATCAALNVCHSHGMPSSHTQFMFFACTVLCLASIRRVPASNALARLLQAAEAAALAAMAVVVAVSRVYLGYHTVHQVLAGGVLGVALGSVWSYLAHRLAWLYDEIARLQVCRMLDINNSWDLPRAKQLQHAAR
jgi:dolichyldiphosphatase